MIENLTKFSFAISMLLFLVSGVSIFADHQGFGLRLLTYCFWFLLSGTAFYFLGLRNEKS